MIYSSYSSTRFFSPSRTYTHTRPPSQPPPKNAWVWSFTNPEPPERWNPQLVNLAAKNQAREAPASVEKWVRLDSLKNLENLASRLDLVGSVET